MAGAYACADATDGRCARPNAGEQADAVWCTLRHGRDRGTLRLRHRRRRVGRQRVGQPPVLGRLQPRPRPRGRAARPELGPLHPDARRAHVPDREPVLRLEVRVRARAPHGRPADLPRARQGARGLQQHQRDDLPARQPVGLRTLGGGARDAGMEYVHRGAPLRIQAGEVLLCAGAINSPQTLQLSGVGNADDLKALGIDVVQDVPGVGENLQDHLEVYVQHACTQPVSVAPYLRWRNRPRVGLEWLLFKRGPGATNHFEGGGFARSNDDVAYPNLMFHFLPIAVRYDGSAPASDHGYQVHIGPMNSDARGTVAVTDTDPRTHPTLRFNYLSTDQDRREWVEAIRQVRRNLGQPAFDPFEGGELSPGSAVETDEEILTWVARDGETALHPSCTCAMGDAADPTAVVDPGSLGVHGIDGLRVIDASVFPSITNGNIYAPVMMVAEKAADLVLGNTPAPPEPVPFYRHAPA